jgi:hypothetical protein
MRQTFVTKVVTAVGQGKLFNDSYFASIRARHVKSLTNSRTSAAKGGWRSYEWVENKEGKMITAELLRLKKLTAKKHASLAGEDSKLQYPYDQLIWWRQELFTELTSVTDTAELEVNSDGADGEALSAFSAGFNDIHAAAWTSMHPMVAGGSSSGNAAGGDGNGGNSGNDGNSGGDSGGDGGNDDDADKTGLPSDGVILAATKNVNICHATWDRKLRECNGVLRRSKQNSMSAKTPLEVSFKKLVDDTIHIDVQLLSFESSVSSKQAVTNQAIKDATENCIKIAENTKTINKMKQALHNLIELSSPI